MGAQQEGGSVRDRLRQSQRVEADIKKTWRRSVTHNHSPALRKSSQSVPVRMHPHELARIAIRGLKLI